MDLPQEKRAVAYASLGLNFFMDTMASLLHAKGLQLTLSLVADMTVEFVFNQHTISGFLIMSSKPKQNPMILINDTP